MRNRGHSQHHHHNYQQQQQRNQLALNPSGAIFMYNNKTKKECFSHRIFGLPASREFFVRQVKERMYLFLFNADDRRMFGVFKAASDGRMNIMPEAFSSSGSTYPAQVQFNIECMYQPLTEKEFKPAIREKYFNGVKFNFDLNSVQVQRLLVLFGGKKVCRIHQSINDRWPLSSSVDSPLEWSYSNRQWEMMSNTNTSDQPVDSNSEGSEVQINSDMIFPTPGSINLYQPIDPTSVTTRTHEIYHTHNRNDPTRLGIINDSSLCLAQQQEPYENQTGTFIGNLSSQRMVSCLGYNPILRPQTQSLLNVNSDNQQVALAGYNPESTSSSQSVQLYASNPSYHGNIVMGVSTPSNFYSGSGLQGQVYNAAPQNDYYSNISKDIGLVGSLKTSRSAGIPCSCQIRSVISRRYPTESKNQPHENANSDLAPNLDQDPNLSLNLNPTPNPTLYSDVEHKKSVFSRIARNPQISPQEKHFCQQVVDLSINQLPPGYLIQNSRHKNGLNRIDTPICKEWVIQDQELAHIPGLAGTDIEAGPDPGVMVDEINVDPTAELLNLNVVPDEIILLVDFKRRNRGNKLKTQLGGDKKKRRLIRPSLKLEDEDNDLPALKAHMHKMVVSSDEQSEQPFLVSAESIYNRENMVLTDTMDVEGQVDSGNSENVLGPGCKTTAISRTEVSVQGLQDHHEGEIVLASSIRMEIVKENQDIDRLEGPFCKKSDSYFRAESLDSSTGESRYENNDEMLVMMEIESQKQNNGLVDPHGPSQNTEICLERLSEKLTVDFEHVSNSESNGSQMILISGSEKLDVFELELESLSKDSSNSSEVLVESLVLSEKPEKKGSVSSSEPVISEPKIEFKDRYVLEIEPDNLTLSVCLHNNAINLQEEYIPLEPEADNLETVLLSLTEPVEDYIALD